MAPEVYYGWEYNEKADMFSLGVVIYEIVQRQMLLASITANGTVGDVERYAKAVAEGYRPQIPKYWPPELKSLVRDCWSQDPMKRPSSADALRRLENIRDVGMPEVEIRPILGPCVSCCKIA